MKLSKEILQLFLKTYPQEKLLLAFVVEKEGVFENVVLDEDGNLISAHEVCPEYLAQIADDESVEVWLEDSDMRKIQNLLGKEKKLLPPINEILSAQEALDFVKLCETMNETSQQKREVRLARDVLLGFFSQGIAELIGSCDALVTKEMVRSIMAKNKEEDKNIDIPITLHEEGFLIFTEQKNNNSQFVDVLKEATADMKEKTDQKISSHMVFTRKTFFEHYDKTRPEVVVLVAHEECAEGMLLYIRLKTIDPFVKLLTISRKEIEGKKEDLVKKLITASKLKYQDIVEKEQRLKKRLDTDTEYDIKQEIRELKKNYEKVNHVKIAYRLQLLSMDYDVRYLLHVVKTMAKK